jgi:hypothetical protein
MIKLVHVDIHEELAGEIPKRQTGADFPLRVETFYDGIEKPHCIAVSDLSPEYVVQYGMIDAREKLPNITLQNPNCTRVIP